MTVLGRFRIDSSAEIDRGRLLIDLGVLSLGLDVLLDLLFDVLLDSLVLSRSLLDGTADVGGLLIPEDY